MWGSFFRKILIRSHEFNSTLLADDLSVNSVLKVKFESNGGDSVFYFGKIV